MTQGCESVCAKKSEIIWNVWKDVLFNALKVWKWGFVKSQKFWNQIKIWTLTVTSLICGICYSVCSEKKLIRIRSKVLVLCLFDKVVWLKFSRSYCVKFGTVEPTWMCPTPTQIEPLDGGAVAATRRERPGKVQLVQGHGTMENVLKILKIKANM